MSHSENHILQKERDILAKELDWLLNSQIPGLLESLNKGLKKCELLIKSPENYDFLSTSTLAISSINTDTLKGFVTLDGSDIIKGELQIKLPSYNRGNFIKVTINSNKSYFIEQLGDAQNYIALALDELNTSKRTSTKENACQLLEKIFKYIQNSHVSLNHTNEERLFPYKICDSRIFNSLPEDLVVQFHVEGSYIITSVYLLQYHLSLPQQKHGSLLGISKQSPKVCKYKDKYVSILDEVVVKSLDPKLEELMENIKKLEKECLSWK
ncbi:1316_t:CDS:10, partial [Entrophospora sp. SA101]